MNTIVFSFIFLFFFTSSSIKANSDRHAFINSTPYTHELLRLIHQQIDLGIQGIPEDLSSQGSLWNSAFDEWFTADCEESNEDRLLCEAYEAYCEGLTSAPSHRLPEGRHPLHRAYLMLEMLLEQAEARVQASKGFSYNDFDSNPFMSKKERKAVRPHLMPPDHPIKPALDAIFTTLRATQDEETFAAAGFITKHSQPRSFIKVASHPSLPGYLVKVYLDTELRLKNDTPGWKWFVRRVEGAEKVRFIVDKNKFKFFTAPKKWIYPLPVNPSPPNDKAYARKNEILVVEDMQLVPVKDNLNAWKTVITIQHLDEFYQIIKFAGGSSYRADNVPYTKTGKFAFIDTEYPYKDPDYYSIKKYLSPEMAEYWKSLIK